MNWKNNRISIHITSKDRLSEILLVLQSLRTQTFHNFDILMLDDASGNPYNNSFLFQSMLNRLKFEDHKIKVFRNNVSLGVCFARQSLITNDKFENEFTMRCDDDVLLEPTYVEKLLNVINKGYDIASGVVPQIQQYVPRRDVKFVKPIVNEIRFDESGKVVLFKDDCGYDWLQDEILPSHGFRTNALYRSDIHKKVEYQRGLSPVGFREETFFSIRAILAGYTIGNHMTARALHFRTPSGGCRHPQYAQMTQMDHQSFLEWMKRQYKIHNDFLAEYSRRILDEKATKNE